MIVRPGLADVLLTLPYVIFDDEHSVMYLIFGGFWSRRVVVVEIKSHVRFRKN